MTMAVPQGRAIAPVSRQHSLTLASHPHEPDPAAELPDLPIHDVERRQLCIAPPIAPSTHVLDPGHLALDEQPDMIADLTRRFLLRWQANTDS
jgi:hypothetical protein